MSQATPETGLRGVPVGYCVTSHVDPQKGVSYRGHPVSEFSSWRPEEVIYLLWNKERGTEEEVTAFYAEMSKTAQVSAPVIEAIKRLPREGHPMRLMPGVIDTLGLFEGTGNYCQDGLNVIAKLPEVVATLINHHAGWGETPPSRPELGYMENFLQMLNLPPEVDRAKIGEVLRIFNVLHYDHSGGNLSTFSGKAIASGGADMYQALSGAMSALSGPKHGKANQDCLAFVDEVLRELGPNATEQQIEQLVRDRLERGELIYGFGHAVLRDEDPRATCFYDLTERLGLDHPLVSIALKLRTVVPRCLPEKVACRHANVDAISGTVLAAAGFNYPEYFTVLFGLSRCVGIARQVVYERLEAREGRGTPHYETKVRLQRSRRVIAICAPFV